ncbi:MAG: VWA domain-containing protein, partial [Myxococcales bacterium]|nr:VWA domain-containing protein [Myxococcales bacterium]
MDDPRGVIYATDPEVVVEWFVRDMDRRSPIRRLSHRLWLCVLGSCALVGACSAADGERGGVGRPRAGAPQGPALPTPPDSPALRGSAPVAATPEVSEAGRERALAWEGARDAGGDPACARQTQGASLNPLHLLFAFDVSGSMGKGDKAWHDRALKWEPVVAATRSFFEEETARGLFASLTFFPGEGGEKTRCTPESYREPDVPMTALPDLAFGEAMDGIGREDWRGGTPTLSVLSGLFDQIEALRPSDSGRYVVVLVTDGHPQDCEDNRIEAVAELVAEHADRVPTYVIGVRNPPVEDAPDNTSDLADIAKAGGTEDAYLIDTGDPARTVARIAEAID